MATNDLDSTTVRGPSGPVHSHIARPAGLSPFPAIVLLQEGLGVTGHLLGLAKRLAGEGFFTLVPDLYSHDKARRSLGDDEVVRWLPLARALNRDALLASLSERDAESARRVIAWFAGRDTSTYLPDVQAAVAHLKRHPEVRPEAIASIGFSLGGGLSAQLAASGADLAAGIIFYGSAPPVDQLRGVRYPLQGHYADHDAAITPNVPAFEAALRAAGKSFSAFVYPGTEHGFFNETRSAFHAPSADLALLRSLAFLREHLGRTEGLPIAQTASARV
ncbi:MAG TPA: dienelactone hydrolase family protein [Polyangiaceae bacterium]|jgi:carboxymethylenebutenolidase|nr:dienelactone hydrolase family protein [Polyangiaceae bacterium]